MCGIPGFVNFTEETVAGINACSIQQHRGPDSQKEMTFGNVVLSPSAAFNYRSRYTFRSDGLAIIFNGEIYNCKELKQQILDQKPGHPFFNYLGYGSIAGIIQMEKRKLS